jgi:hypothetical protein
MNGATTCKLLLSLGPDITSSRNMASGTRRLVNRGYDRAQRKGRCSFSELDARALATWSNISIEITVVLVALSSAAGVIVVVGPPMLMASNSQSVWAEVPGLGIVEPLALVPVEDVPFNALGTGDNGLAFLKMELLTVVGHD